MPRPRIRMRQFREVLRLHHVCHLSHQRIADALKLSKGSVHNVLERFRASGLTWPLEASITDDELESLLHQHREEPRPGAYPMPDFDRIHRESALPHVTVQLLWEEYAREHPDGMSRTTFYRHYGRYKSKLPPEMKVIHKGGDKLFVDFSGKKLAYVDRSTGEEVPVEFFVASWGASSYCYADVVPSQAAEDFVLIHVQAFAWFGCVPAAVVPDNLKSGVLKASFYDPTLNPLYQKMAEHYGTVILPARVRKPKDKAVVESNVGHLQRWVFGRLRNQTFFSFAELRRAVQEEVEAFNNRPMKQYGGATRRERFEALDRPFAKKLPPTPFILTRIKMDVRVAPNYHIEFDRHFYSVPSALARQCVDVYQSGQVLEIYHQGRHVCRHRKAPSNYQYTTIDEHMPAAHRWVAGWSREMFMTWANRIGPATAEAAGVIMAKRKHPEQGYRAVMGVLRLADVYTAERLEHAARRALHFGNVSSRSIKAILEQNLDQAPIEEKENGQLDLPLPVHDNIRGSAYYKTPSPGHHQTNNTHAP